MASRFPISRLVIAAVLSGLGAAVFVLSQRVPMWAEGMTYGFRQPRSLPGGIVPPMFLLLLGGTHWSLWRAAQTGSKKRECGWLALLCALMLCLNIALHAGEDNGLARWPYLVMNPASGGYYYAAFDADKLPNPANWVRDYALLMDGHHHVETHPPGGVAVMRWLRAQALTGGFWTAVPDAALIVSPGTHLQQLATIYQTFWLRDYQPYDVAAAWWAGFIFIVCAALLPAAIYALARPLCGPPAAAHAAALTALVPSFALLSPALDALTALCAAVTLALCAHGYLKNKIVLVALAGIVAGIGMIFSFAMVAPLLIAIGFFKWQAWRGLTTWKRAITMSAALVAGVLVMLLFFAANGVNWPEIYRLTHHFQAKVMVDYHRPWQKWIIFNLVDFFYFLDLPCCVLLGAALCRSRQLTTQMQGLLLPALGVLLLVHFGANVWAESARIWMLFTPPLLVAAGCALQRQSEKSSAALPLIFAAQAAQLLAMAAALDVWSF